MAEKKEDSMQSLMDSITKKYGDGSVFGADGANLNIERVSTGSMSLDIATGGGWGVGKIVEIYGPESSGKTTLAIHSLVAAQKQFPDKYVAIIDAEHALDLEYAEKLHLDRSRVIISQPDNGEQAVDILIDLVSSGKVSMALVDSVAALTPKSELEGEMGDAQMGVHARLMSKALRKVTGIANNSNTTIIFINQLRSKIGVMFGNPEVTTGGNALKFYASTRVDVRRSAGEKEGEEFLSNLTKCNVVKNKLSPPFRKCAFFIRFGEGIDKVGEILDICVEAGIIKQGGSWYSYGDTKLGQGSTKVKELLRDNPELLEELEQSIRERIEK